MLVTVVLYAISAVYFAGVMVRLMLTLTPVVCILAAIAFSKTFEVYLKDEGKKPATQEEQDKDKNDKYYDKVGAGPLPTRGALSWGGQCPLCTFMGTKAAYMYMYIVKVSILIE